MWQEETTQASQPILITTQEAINGIYRRIKGYLQNYAFPGNEVAFVIHCVKYINEDQLASNIKCNLNRKEGEVEGQPKSQLHSVDGKSTPPCSKPIHSFQFQVILVKS